MYPNYFSSPNGGFGMETNQNFPPLNQANQMHAFAGGIPSNTKGIKPNIGGLQKPTDLANYGSNSCNKS